MVPNSQIKKLYDNLINDEDFDRLDLGLKVPNIFQILKITKNEIRHTNFLSWIINPTESHNLGDMFLKRFLRDVFSSDKFTTVDQIDVEGLNLSNVRVHREWNNIDLLIVLENIVVCVENKVMSKEHSNQLSRYKRLINTHFPNHKKTFVYLNPEGNTSDNEQDIYHPVSYQFIIDTLERIISIQSNSISNNVKTYIVDYITIIKRELMKNDELTILSRKIYQNHKELLDFIIEHKPDLIDELRGITLKEIEKRGWILGTSSKSYLRWYTEPMKNLIHINTQSNGWKNKESFLFEMEFYPPSNKLLFRTVISPCDPNYDNTVLDKILQEIPGSKKPIGKKWLVNFTIKQDLNYDELSNMEEEEILEIVNTFLNKISKTITSVEEKFLQHSTKILSLKQ